MLLSVEIDSLLRFSRAVLGCGDTDVIRLATSFGFREWELLDCHRLIDFVPKHAFDGIRAANPDADQVLRRAQERIEAQNERMRRFGEVLDDFRSRGIGYVICKGPAQGFHAYADPCARSYRDIDLLVEAHRVPEIHRLLCDRGYRQYLLHEDAPGLLQEIASTPLPKASHRVMSNYEDDAQRLPTVEVHVAPPNGRFEDAWNLLLSSQPIDLLGVQASILDLPRALALFVSDKIKDLKAGDGFRIRDFLEVALLVSKVARDPEAIRQFVECADQLARPAEVDSLFRLIRRVFGASIEAPGGRDGDETTGIDTLERPEVFAAAVIGLADEARSTIRSKLALAALRAGKRPTSDHPSLVLPLKYGGAVEVSLHSDPDHVRCAFECDARMLAFVGWLAVEFRFQGLPENSWREQAYRLTWDRGEVSLRQSADFRSGGRSQFVQGPSPTWTRDAGRVRIEANLPIRELPLFSVDEVSVARIDINARREFIQARACRDRKVVKVAELEGVALSVG